MTNLESSAPSVKATKAPAAKPAAKLVKTGIGGNKGYAWVAAALVTNASEDNVGRFVTVNFNLLDNDGELVATQNQVEQFTSAKQPSPWVPRLSWRARTRSPRWRRR